MRFLVIVKVLPTIAGRAGDQELRRQLGPQFGRIMGSGKIEDAGFLGGVRGAFFLTNLDSADELYTLFGPEVYGICEVQAYPVFSLERGAQIFQEWEQAGR